MKCPSCGKAKLRHRRVPFTHGNRYLGDFEADVCPDCGEILFTETASELINARAKQLGLWGKKSSRDRHARSPREKRALVNRNPE